MTEEAAPGAAFRLVHLEGGAAQLKEITAPAVPHKPAVR
jgi:hypothetical protein